VKGWIKEIRSRYPDAHIWLDCIDTHEAAKLHPDVECVNHAWRFTHHRFLGMWPWVSGERIEAIAEQLTALIAPTLPSVPKRIHVVGGGFLNDIWRRNFGLIAYAAALSKHTGSPASASGLSLNPISPASWIRFKQVARRFDLVDMRDLPETSPQASTAGLRIRHTGDDLYHFFCSDSPVKQDTSGAPCLHVCAHTEKIQQRCPSTELIRILRDGCESFLRQYPKGKLHFHQLRHDMDLVPATELGSLAHSSQVQTFEHLWEHGFHVGPQDQYVSTRFHFSMAMRMAGLRGTEIFWNGYYADKFATLDTHIPNRGGVIDLRAGGTGNGSSGFSRQTLDDPSAQKSQLIQELFPNLSPQKGTRPLQAKRSPPLHTAYELGL
jgi:hypothetical protein